MPAHVLALEIYHVSGSWHDFLILDIPENTKDAAMHDSAREREN